jgi:hypothetical protein
VICRGCMLSLNEHLLSATGLPPSFVGLAKIFYVNSDVPAGTVLDSFGFFDPNPLAVLNFTVTSVQPVTGNFAVQPTGINSGTKQWHVHRPTV